jgi:hypothetical protein
MRQLPDKGSSWELAVKLTRLDHTRQKLRGSGRALSKSACLRHATRSDADAICGARQHAAA